MRRLPTFWIVDAFPSDAERQDHLNGPIAAALMANADRLLSSAPQISPADVLAAKTPQCSSALARLAQDAASSETEQTAEAVGIEAVGAGGVHVAELAQK